MQGLNIHQRSWIAGRLDRPACFGAPRRAAPSRRSAVRVAAQNVVAGGKVYVDPVKKECKAFAPATVANLGPGFDWLGCAVEVRSLYLEFVLVYVAIPRRPGLGSY